MLRLNLRMRFSKQEVSGVRSATQDGGLASKVLMPM